MNATEAVVLGIIQGVTEFLPISSSGHLILARELFGITITSLDLSIDIFLHLATLLAIILYFNKDVFSLCKAGVTCLRTRSNETVLLWAILIGTIPAVIAGFYLEDIVTFFLRDIEVVLLALLAGSLVMYLADYVYTKRVQKWGSLSPFKGLIIGLFQTLALIPGMSRSGMTISGGMFLGLHREEATRFSFLLALPIIAGSGAKKVVDLLQSQTEIILPVVPIVFGAISAFIVGFLTIHYFLAFVRKYSLKVFVWYRIFLVFAFLLLL